MGMMYSVHGKFQKSPKIEVEMIEDQKCLSEFKDMPFMVRLDTYFVWLSRNKALELVNKLNQALLEYDMSKVSHG